MADQVFYRKWRPQTLAEIIGQEQVTRTLRNALSSGQIAHAYLFCGPRGTGKTSTGRILAKAVNCLTNNGRGEPCNTCSLCQAITEGSALDMVEIDAASNRGIDDIRDLREKVNYAPNQARYKVYIIDEAHMLTKEASNALLKTLEEPPAHIIFILATTEVHKILPTIMSRCQRFDFRRISQADTVLKLEHICNTQGIKIDPEGLRLVAKSAAGSLRDAENLLEQLTIYYGSEIDLPQARAILGISGDWRAKELARHIINDNVSAGIATINSINNDGLELRQFNRELVEYLRGLLLIKTGVNEVTDFTAEEIDELKELAARASLPQILKAVKLFGQLAFSFDNYSTLPLELALVDYALPLAEEKNKFAIQTEYEPAEVVKPTPSPVTTARPKKPLAKFEPTSIQPPEEPPKTSPDKYEPTTIQVSGLESTEVTSVKPEISSEIEKLIQNWKNIINEAPGNVSKTPAAALLRSAKPVNMQEDVVVLSFRYPLHKENMEKPENQKIAAEIISNFLMRPCHIRCIHQPEDNHLVEAALKMGAQIVDVEEK